MESTKQLMAMPSHILRHCQQQRARPCGMLAASKRVVTSPGPQGYLRGQEPVALPKGSLSFSSTPRKEGKNQGISCSCWRRMISPTLSTSAGVMAVHTPQVPSKKVKGSHRTIC